jgi:hypothetical protein
MSFLRRFRNKRFLVLLAALGPGIISALAGDDAGGVGTYSIAGAAYGYSLLWVLLVITLALAVVQDMCARMGVVTGKGLSDLIREEFGVRTTALAMVALLIANAAVTVSDAGEAAFRGVPLGSYRQRGHEGIPLARIRQGAARGDHARLPKGLRGLRHAAI